VNLNTPRRLAGRSAPAKREFSTSQSHSFSIAAAVITEARKGRPADAVLRAELKRQPGLQPELAGETSRLVFDYYRWFGWADQQQPLKVQLDQIRALSEQFARDPASVSAKELCGKAVPGWVGEQMEVSADWVKALQSEPRLWLRARPGQGPVLARELGDCRPAGQGNLGDCLEYCGQADLFRTKAFHAGEFEIQDISSQLVGIMCGPTSGETWWDACAGEGGKTLHLADLMQNQGLIWASDRAAWRLAKLKRRAARAKIFNYRSVFWNGAPKLPTRTKFDGVLVDAPCSGLGTWHRNPDARWTTTLIDVQELAAVQKQLLLNVAPSIKPGGRLIYAVCTLTRAETVEVVASVTSTLAGFEPLPLPNPLQAEAPLAPQQWLWPQIHRGNGMFIAAWRRNGAHS
jgi:16S rRNA (cytosine967-C5)-methyltransferase